MICYGGAGAGAGAGAHPHHSRAVAAIFTSNSSIILFLSEKSSPGQPNRTYGSSEIRVSPLLKMLPTVAIIATTSYPTGPPHTYPRESHSRQSAAAVHSSCMPILQFANSNSSAAVANS